MKTPSSLDIPKIGWWGIFILIGLGILMRFYQITQDEFYLYDEGLYLNYNHMLLKLWSLHPPEDWEQWKQALLVWFRFSLASGKALWFLLIDARIFFGGLKLLFFPRLVSAVAGVLTLWVTFLFAKRFFTDFSRNNVVVSPNLPLKYTEEVGTVPTSSKFIEESRGSIGSSEPNNSKWIGLLSAAFLAVLPSHVFYSRLGFQEALSTLFFISGFYFYVFPRTLNKRTFFSSLLFVGAYFTNYRLIVLPVLVAFCEMVLSFSEKRFPNCRKYLWHTLTFLFFVIIIGNLDMKENAMVTYSWMFHQANLAEGHFDWINLFSYPYYLFRLESFLFGLLFWGNLYYIYRREWNKIFPLAMVCLPMFIFSFPPDKAARYLCVATPFMAMAAASLIVSLFEQAKDQVLKAASIGICILAFMTLFVKSFQITAAHSDYRPSIEFLTKRNPEAGVLTTQPWIQNLYVANQENVAECPHKFEQFLQFYTKGFRYLILCPQTYISWTEGRENEKRFHFQLEGYLEFVASSIKPVKVFPHLSRVMLERFVFEHNENLWQSVAFLNSRRKDLGAIRVYDIEQVLGLIRQRMKHQTNFNNQ